jgi:VIT1/CCC1 family predicted Fe2+/Mn2+ transporter
VRYLAIAMGLTIGVTQSYLRIRAGEAQIDWTLTAITCGAIAAFIGYIVFDSKRI